MVIYKTTNLINDKIYVGQDLYNDPAYLGSGLLLNKAIKKYGKENFKKEILEYCISPEHMNEREVYWIKTLNCQNSQIGYNLAEGGRTGRAHLGHKHSEATKQKLKESSTGKARHLGIKHSEKTKQRISLLLKGRKLPEATKQKMSEAQRLRVPDTEETRRKRSEAQKGKTHSEETRRKLREINTGRTRSKESIEKQRKSMMGKNKGKAPWTKGRHLSEEHKRKIGEANSIALKGHSPSHKGKTGIYSKETLEKMSLAKKGKKLSKEHREKIGEGVRRACSQ